MALRVASGIPGRVNQVLQDRLTTELGLIDAEEADGITTPAVPVANYSEWDRRLVTDYPAISLRIIRSSIQRVWPVTFGSRIQAQHHVEVRAHVQIANFGQDALRLQKLIYRYGTAILRVLAVKYNGLATIADPNPVPAYVVDPDGDILWGPEDEQESGTATRTATVPVLVWRIES